MVGWLSTEREKGKSAISRDIVTMAVLSSPLLGTAPHHHRHGGTLILQWLERKYATQSVPLLKSSVGCWSATLIRQRYHPSSNMNVVGRRYITSSSTSTSSSSLSSLSWKDHLPTGDDDVSRLKKNRPSWSEEWKSLGLGAELVDTATNFPTNLLFVELGFGVDQHGDRTNATKAATRAIRNAIEFNSIPGVIKHVPGGRSNMLIHVKLGVPPQQANDGNNSSSAAGAETKVDRLEVAKVFPYGKLLPIQVTVGGLEFATGRVVEELGDVDDIGICVCACISIGYDDDDVNNDHNSDTSENYTKEKRTTTTHKTYNTKDGY